MWCLENVLMLFFGLVSDGEQGGGGAISQTETVL